MGNEENMEAAMLLRATGFLRGQAPSLCAIWARSFLRTYYGHKLSIFKGVQPDSIYLDPKVVMRELLSALSIY